ncbi:MAG: dihydrolipoamide acetyltransferase [Spartobacteria bacterium AMD-G4]|nr:MAG: dihydrolipoamide acetyltransferase [Spartobacteria bacterium AMD-G4]
MNQITMPKLSDTMLEGTLIKWHKKVGDKITVGDVIADVETDKATMEMEAFDEGTITEIIVPEGGVVKVGQPLANLEGGKKSAVKSSAPAAVASMASMASTPTLPASTKPQTATLPNGSHIKASPLAKKIALERGVSLLGVQGTGPGGRVVAADVPTAATTHTAAPAAPRMEVPFSDADTKTPLSGMRRTIAERLLASKTQIPHFYLTIEIDAAPLAKLRKELNAAAETDGTAKVTVNDFILLAAARAAKQHPRVNSAFAGDSIVEYGSVNLSVAIAVEDGLITPVIRDAQSLSLRAISTAVKDLAVRARSKKIKPEEYQGGTLTISNLGAYGIDSFYAIINPPQAAILAVGAIVKKPVVNAQDQIVAGQRMTISLSGDHRVVDGAAGAEFLATMRKSLESPTSLLF